ncbi:hypothetical protein CDD80_6616 [Ophiocordyceps camponoti-rufipedis]|uniref:Trichodiene synthase n=1 Tax=Ophiocordyceps camponoti-rufipedis TaxID=2004952 RepID=A0A2C5YPF1_9HYPO|nr:hypothetical protein CDD80_6616 [Ophiocordyceps camponoti-rufipedis]
MDTFNSHSTLYISSLRQYLDTIQYHDTNYSREERLAALQHIYSETIKHLPLLPPGIPPKTLQHVIQTSTQIVVCCWSKLPPPIMVDLSIYFVLLILLDDDGFESSGHESWDAAGDLLAGGQKRNVFWAAMAPHLGNFVRHYGGFCGLAILRSTLDFYTGCWVEKGGFGGFAGSLSFPWFLRNLNGLGDVSSVTMFPACMYDEETILNEITTVMAELTPSIVLVNDLFSFYKECGRDEAPNFIANRCKTEGLSLEDSLRSLTAETCESTARVLSVLKGRDAGVYDAVRGFVQGYVTWHICDDRYRLHELYDCCGEGSDEGRFREYFEEATAIGRFDVDEWAVPRDGIRNGESGGREAMARMGGKL